MDIQKPLFWHQGLFLQPQHMQLLDVSFQSRLIPFQRFLSAHFWGISQLEVKTAALGIRSFGLVRGHFLWPDGTYVEFPGNAILEDRSFEDAWMDGGKPLAVYVGLRKWNTSGENVTVVKKDDTLSEVVTRFVAGTDPQETRDLHAGGPAGQVKKLTYLLKFFWESETDHLGDYDLIPVARLERVGAGIELAPHYIPPCVSTAGSDLLVGLIQEIGNQLLARSRQLEEHKSQRGIHTAEFGSRDMVYLLALRSINRYLPWFLHYSQESQLHPWHLYGILRQVIGDLSCFSENISVLGQDGDGAEPSLPSYDPLRLWDCFSAAQGLIIRMLDNITAGPDYIVNLPLKDHLYTADLKPAIFDGHNAFFLALTTPEDPKTVVPSMATVAKLSSRSHLGRLISHALPGIPTSYVAVPPQELPRRRNVLYFSIDSHHEYWSDVKKEHAIALSWDGAPEGLQIDLMVVTR